MILSIIIIIIIIIIITIVYIIIKWYIFTDIYFKK